MQLVLTTLGTTSQAVEIISEEQAVSNALPTMVWIIIIVGCFIMLKLLTKIEAKDNELATKRGDDNE